MPWKDKEKRNAYMRRRYASRLAAIHAALGGKCALCSATENLHVDHVVGRGYVARKMSSDQRITLYEKELKVPGHLRLLCESCNCSSKNHPPGCTCGRSGNQPHPPPAMREPGEDDE